MKLLKKITSVLLSVLLINVSFSCPVMAAEDMNVVELEASVAAINSKSGLYAQPRSTTFIDTTILISFSESGMDIVIYTDVGATASVVGAKDIEIQKKGLFGWTTVATSTGGEAYNVGGCTVSLTYTGAEYEEIYRVVCTHYGQVDEYRELYHETLGYTCIY